MSQVYASRHEFVSAQIDGALRPRPGGSAAGRRRLYGIECVIPVPGRQLTSGFQSANVPAGFFVKIQA